MATKSTLANLTVIDDTEVYAVYSGTGSIKCFLPQITAAGSGSADDAPGVTHVVECTAAGVVEVCDYRGRRVGIVGNYGKIAFTSDTIADEWTVTPCAPVFQLSATQVQASAAATPTLGTAAPIVAGAPTKYMKVIGDDGVVYISLLWTFA